MILMKLISLRMCWKWRNRGCPWHLDVLKKANLVVAERRANQIIYSLNLSVMQEFVGKMVEFLDDMKDLKEVRKYESNKGAYNN